MCRTFFIMWVMFLCGIVWQKHFKEVEEPVKNIMSCEKAYNACKNYQYSSEDCDWNEIWMCIHS